MSDRHQQKPYPLRMSEDLRAQLEAEAKTIGRSLHAEIIARLEGSLSAKPGVIDHRISLDLDSEESRSYAELLGLVERIQDAGGSPIKSIHISLRYKKPIPGIDEDVSVAPKRPIAPPSRRIRLKG